MPCSQYALILLIGAVSASSGATTLPLHDLMNEVELEHYFGSRENIDPDNYQVTTLEERLDVRKRTGPGDSSSSSAANATLGQTHLQYGFDAFGSHFNLNLQRNDVILSPFHSAGVLTTADSKTNETERRPMHKRSRSESNCHYLHRFVHRAARCVELYYT